MPTTVKLEYKELFTQDLTPFKTFYGLDPPRYTFDYHFAIRVASLN